MSIEKGKCKYQHPYDKKCPHPVYEDGWCIFHLPKPDKSELNPGSEEYLKYEEVKERFLNEFAKLVKDTEEDKALDYYDFQGFNFPEIELRTVIFSKDAYFSGAIFSGTVDFRGVQFHNQAIFYGTKFQHFVFFKNAKFHNKAEFNLAKFAETASFRDAEFQSSADFSEVKFKDSTYFIGTEFYDETNFIKARFRQQVFFIDTKFLYKAYFYGAKFEGRAEFEGFRGGEKGRERNECFQDQLYFNAIELGEKSQVIFNKVNLRQTSFQDTDIENFTFRDVTWHQPQAKKLWLPREKALFDEFRYLYPELLEKEKYLEEMDYSKLAENYSQLVLNYEKRRDFLSAHEFRIGEMEARRKSIGTKARPRWRKVREWFNTYSLYRILSNYGTSYRQALGVLALMLLGFAGLFLFSGFLPLSPEGARLSAINYNWSFDTAPLWQTLCDYGKSVLFTLSILTLQRSRFYVPLGGWSQLWLFLATIMFYSQVTLLLLAIRRRFKQ